MQGGVAVFHPTSGYQATPQMHAQSPAPVMQGKHAMHTPQYPQQVPLGARIICATLEALADLLCMWDTGCTGMQFR